METENNSNNNEKSLPTSKQLENELERVNSKYSFIRFLKSTVAAVVVTVAVVIIINTFALPVMKIYGNSMLPSVSDGNIVVALKTDNLQPGDICSFYNNNSILCKRVIAVEGDIVNIDAEGNVYVNNDLLDEPYLTDKNLGNCEITFPYTVPEDSYFVLGDNRATSVDSRSNKIGCVSKDRIVGKILFCIWPISAFGKAK